MLIKSRLLMSDILRVNSIDGIDNKVHSFD